MVEIPKNIIFQKIKYIKTSYSIGASLARNLGAKNAKSKFLHFWMMMMSGIKIT